LIFVRAAGGLGRRRQVAADVTRSPPGRRAVAILSAAHARSAPGHSIRILDPLFFDAHFLTRIF
jgi:hypothetical protein